MAGQEKNEDKWLKDKATKDRMLWRANPENYLNTKVEETKYFLSCWIYLQSGAIFSVSTFLDTSI